MWLKADWTAKNAYIFDWADSLDYRSGNDNMRFNLRSIKTGVLRFGFYFNQSSPVIAQANVLAHNNKWMLVTCVINPQNIESVAAEYWQGIHINGELMDSSTVRISAIHTGNNSIHMNKGCHFRIGCRHQLDSNSFYQGAMDNFQVHANLIGNGGLKTFTCNKNALLSNPVLYYGMNEGLGITAADSSTSKANGFIQNATWTQGAINPNNKLPLLSFTDTTESPSLGAKFTNTSTNASTFKWTFGDGDSSTNTSVYHAFPYPDTFRVCLDGSNSCQLKGVQVCKDIIIVCPDTDAKYTYNVAGKKVIFEALKGEKYTYAWNFGDGKYTQPAENEDKQVYTFSDTGTYTVCVAARSPCGRDTSFKEIKIEAVTNVSNPDEENADFSVFPNPAKEQVIVNCLAGGGIQISLIDIGGKVHYKETSNSSSVSISVKDFESGLYFIEAKGENMHQIHKLFIQ